MTVYGGGKDDRSLKLFLVVWPFFFVLRLNVDLVFEINLAFALCDIFFLCLVYFAFDCGLLLMV